MVELKFTQDEFPGKLTIKLIFNVLVEMDAMLVRKLTDVIMGFQRAIGLASFRFRVKPPGSNPLLYSYEFTANDGRKWNQEILFDVLANPLMDFSTDKFRLSEFTAHRELRDLCVSMHQFGLTDANCSFA